MATVRRIRAQVDRKPLPGFRGTAASTPLAEGVGTARARAQTWETVGDVGAAAGRLGAAIYTDITTKERQRANEVAINGASNELDEWELSRIHDPEKGALNIRGKESFTLPTEVKREFNELADDIESRLTTQEQKLAFAKIRAQKGGNISLDISRHVSGEMRKFDGEQLDATVASAASLAAAHALDPVRVGQEITKGVDAIRAGGKRNGASAEATELKVAAFRSGAHIAVIDNMIELNHERAAALYFEAVEEAGQIAGDKIDDVRGAIRAGTIRGESQKVSDEILRAGGTLADQQEKIRAIEDDDLRDAVQTRVDRGRAINDRIERDNEEATSKGVYDILDQTKDVNKIPRKVWHAMSGGQRSAARSYARSLIEGTASVKTDQKVFYALSRMAVENPEAFAKINLYDMARSKLSDGDFQQVTGWQMARAKGTPDASLDNVFTTLQVFDRTTKAMGIEEGQAIDLQRRFTQEVEREQRATGSKKLSSSDMQAILDRLLISQTSGGDDWIPFNEKTKRGYEMTIQDVPPAMRRQIVDSLRKRSQPIDEQSILDVYLRSLARAK